MTDVGFVAGCVCDCLPGDGLCDKCGAYDSEEDLGPCRPLDGLVNVFSVEALVDAILKLYGEDPLKPDPEDGSSSMRA